MRDNACYRRQCHSLPLSRCRVRGGVRRQEKLSGPPRDHATVGLEAGPALEPIEVAIKLGHQGSNPDYS